MAKSGEGMNHNLQGLLASLRAPSNGSTTAASGETSHFASQSHSFDSMNRTDRARAGIIPTPTGDQTQVDRTTNLLNLLKFNQPASSNPATATDQGPPSVPRSSLAGPESSQPLEQRVSPSLGMSSSNLVASFMGKSASPAPRDVTRPSPIERRPVSELPQSSTSSPQDFLLQLLNKQKPRTVPSNSLPPEDGRKSAQPAAPDAVLNALSRDLEKSSFHDKGPAARVSEQRPNSQRRDSPIRVFGSGDGRQTTPFQPPEITTIGAQTSPLFTYVNPFEQLAASSPRNSKPKYNGPVLPGELAKTVDHSKRKSKESSPASTPQSSRRRLTPGGSDILQSIEGPDTIPLGDGRSQIEALIGIGAPTVSTETVSEALNEVGDQVNRQVEYALAQAVEQEEDERIKQESMAQEEALDAVENFVHDTAIEVKYELDKKENRGLLEESMPQPAAAAIKEVIDEAVNGHGGDIWEDAEGEPTSVKKLEDDPAVEVFNFPMRPFVSIDLKQDQLSSMNFPQDAVMEIARIKKEFDQIDRTLATATSDYILYAMPKANGLRIIRQRDGLSRQVFKDIKDRIFNTFISTAPADVASSGVQTILATAVSGAVYWTTIAMPSIDLFESEKMDECSLAFPPVSAHDEYSSGGQLKTRAKKSTRHPEFFAIGRGKAINIIFPTHTRGSPFLDSKSGVVDTERYLADRSLKINTGKAGKDFTFSEDDTMIITLDKAGRLRFWDIEDLVNEANATAHKLAPVEVKAPILTFSTAVASEKSWPTSVLFVDKLRPYNKGKALRYVIIGMKQNHTLQLWDLGLGKPVQELNFPHEKETDAICSVTYHPASGIIVVGHPTRNSVYFIHLSAPKYNLPSMSQAKYAQRLAAKDLYLPKPEATAIMGGFREYTLSPKIQLRSIDLLPAVPDSTRLAEDEDGLCLFELYLMHSKGVTCLRVSRRHLGWSSENKVLNPVDAEEAGLVIIKELQDPSAGPVNDSSLKNGDTALAVPASASSVKPPKESTRSSLKPQSRSGETNLSDVASGDQAVGSELASGSASVAVEKAEKKKKKRTGATAGDTAVRMPSQAPSAPDVYTTAGQTPRHSKPQAPLPGNTKDSDGSAPISTNNDKTRSKTNSENINLGVSEDFLDLEIKKIEKAVSDEFSKVLGQEIDGLYRRLDDDRRVQNAAGNAKQEAVLRLVSSTLTENVDKALTRIISSSMRETVVPAVINVVSSSMSSKISEIMTQQMSLTIPSQLKQTLPDAMSSAVQNADVLRTLTDQISLKLGSHIEKEFVTVLHNTVSPTLKDLVLNATQNLSTEMERRVANQSTKFETQRRTDNVKLDQLTALVRGLSETVRTMAAAQTEFQSEILKLQQQSFRERDAGLDRAASGQNPQLLQGSGDVPPPRKSPEALEVEHVTALMTEGRYEEGTVQVFQILLCVLQKDRY